MAENKGLYFIPILSRALRSDQPEQAMKEAFDEVRALGLKPGYENGYSQFQEFVKAALEPSEPDSPLVLHRIREAIYRLMYALAANTFEGSEEQKKLLISEFEKDSEWSSEYHKIREEFEDSTNLESQLSFEILKDGQSFGSYPIGDEPLIIKGISIGVYTIRLSNGRVLWEDRLTREDVLWTYAFPDKELPMAAETEPLEKTPAWAISLLEGEFVMRIFPGLESAMISIEKGLNAG